MREHRNIQVREQTKKLSFNDVLELVLEMLEVTIMKLGAKRGVIACTNEGKRTTIFIGEAHYDKKNNKVHPRKGITIIVDDYVDCDKLDEELRKYKIAKT